MPLIRLDISNFRNFTAVKIEPLANGFNLVYGNNGSGKTSLLEAIYYLSLGRSFRSSVISRIIQQEADKFSLFAHTLSYNSQAVPIGIERHQNSAVKIRIAGTDVSSIAELADLTPVLLINSNCYNLLDAGPVYRRKYLDWGMFYQNKDFLRLWRQFERVLKQRNAALQGRCSKSELEAWTQELVDSAVQFDAARSEYTQQLFPLLLETITELLPIPNLTISYQAGWESGKDYREKLAQSLARDIQLGYTQFGPHRADLKVMISNVPAKDILSRGQQKLFVCAMILAQGVLLNCSVNKQPIYLIDDLPSELDMISRANLIAMLSRQKAQMFVTAIECNALDILTKASLRMFHVEHGNITEVS